MNNNKGFTLVELLVSVGFLSVASVSTYNIASYANDFRVIRNEVNDLSQFVKDIENTTNTTDFNDETISTLRQYKSNLELSSITTKKGNLLLNYSNVKARICIDFVNKMITGNKNITAVINGKDIGKNDLAEISNSCLNQNELSIVLNKTSSYTIETITASVNPPPPAHIDVVIPETPESLQAKAPTVPAFIPSTAIPVVYSITGTAPVYPVITPPEGVITVTGGTTIGTVKPPVWTAPVFTPAGNPGGWGVDEIDQNPLPPTPPPAPTPAPAGLQIVQGNTLNICRPLAGMGTFYWLGNMKAGIYKPVDYVNSFRTFGTSYNAQTKAFYDTFVSALKSNNNGFLNNYVCAHNGQEANGIPINQQ